MTRKRLIRSAIPFAMPALLVALPASVEASTIITFMGVAPGAYASYTEAGMVFTDFSPATETFQIIPFGPEQEIRKVGGFNGGVSFRLVDGSPFALKSLVGGGGGNFNVLFTGFDVFGGQHTIASTGGLILFPQSEWSQIVEVDMDVTRFITGGVGTIADVVFDPSQAGSLIPEPASVFSLGSGLAGLVTMTWRRRRRK